MNSRYLMSCLTAKSTTWSKFMLRQVQVCRPSLGPASAAGVAARRHAASEIKTAQPSGRKREEEIIGVFQTSFSDERGKPPLGDRAVRIVERTSAAVRNGGRPQTSAW